MRWVMRLVALMLVTLFLVGCNTIQGLGEDLKIGGEKIKKAASK